jgi:hypothetical protein
MEKGVDIQREEQRMMERDIYMRESPCHGELECIITNTLVLYIDLHTLGDPFLSSRMAE